MNSCSPPSDVDWIVPQDVLPVRIDRLIAAKLENLRRTRAKALIEGGEVAVDGVLARDPARIVHPGTRVSVRIPPPVAPTQLAASIPLDIIHEDEHLIVVNKQPGLVVHPAPGHREDTLVNALIAHCGDSLSGIGGVARPGIVHRLDRDTSGLLVVAKTDEAHIRLAAAISAREVERAYQAVCWKVPVPRAGRIDGAIGRHPRHRTRMAVVTRGGRAADTRYRTLYDVDGEVSLLECQLGTGRTHQVRVHMASVHCPLVGDSLYGRARTPPATLDPSLSAQVAAFPRQALHAYRLALTHPATGSPLCFEASPPRDFDRLLAAMQTARKNPASALDGTAPKRHL